jgi:hypothetical protein
MTKIYNDPVLEQAKAWLIDILKKTNAPRSRWHLMVEFLTMLRTKNLDLGYDEFMQLFRFQCQKLRTISRILYQKAEQVGATSEDMLRDVLSKADFKEAIDAAEAFQNSET